MPKTKHPVADYITFDQYQQMLKNEPDDAMRLCYRYIWTFMLRVSECVGQSDSDVSQIKQVRKEAKKIPLKRNHERRQYWTGPLPGLRLMDIDSVSAKELGLDSDHTINVYRKMGKFETLPFNDKQLYKDTMQYVKERSLSSEQRLFPFYRQRVLDAMNAHGLTVGGRTKIHPHALRRGGGVYMRSAGMMELEDLQAVYSHTNMSQTLAYLGIDKRVAFNKFAQAQKQAQKILNKPQ